MSSSSHHHSIRAACFDLGGVVVRVCRTWAEGCGAAGLPVRDDSFCAEHPREGFWEINREYQQGRISGREYTEQISRAVDGLYSPDEVHLIHEHWILGEYEGVPDILDDLNHSGFSTCALSNTSNEHWRQMENHAWRSRMRHQFASHQMHLVKPDPAIFQNVEKILGCTGAEIVFFDDTPEHLAAAASLDWRVHLIDPALPTAPQIQIYLNSCGLLKPSEE